MNLCQATMCEISLLVHHVRNFLSLLYRCKDVIWKTGLHVKSTKLYFLYKLLIAIWREAVTTPAADRGLFPAHSCGEVLTATSAPGSPVDSPLCEEYYPALPRLQWGGITHEAYHFWMPESLVIWFYLHCSSWECPGPALHLGRLGHS